jgi:hypothetical protein
MNEEQQYAITSLLREAQQLHDGASEVDRVWERYGHEEGGPLTPGQILWGMEQLRTTYRREAGLAGLSAYSRDDLGDMKAMEAYYDMLIIRMISIGVLPEPPEEQPLPDPEEQVRTAPPAFLVTPCMFLAYGMSGQPERPHYGFTLESAPDNHPAYGSVQSFVWGYERMDQVIAHCHPNQIFQTIQQDLPAVWHGDTEFPRNGVVRFVYPDLEVLTFDPRHFYETLHYQDTEEALTACIARHKDARPDLADWIDTEVARYRAYLQEGDV